MAEAEPSNVSRRNKAAYEQLLGKVKAAAIAGGMKPEQFAQNPGLAEALLRASLQKSLIGENAALSIDPKSFRQVADAKQYSDQLAVNFVAVKENNPKAEQEYNRVKEKVEDSANNYQNSIVHVTNGWDQKGFGRTTLYISSLNAKFDTLLKENVQKTAEAYKDDPKRLVNNPPVQAAVQSPAPTAGANETKDEKPGKKKEEEGNWFTNLFSRIGDFMKNGGLLPTLLTVGGAIGAAVSDGGFLKILSIGALVIGGIMLASKAFGQGGGANKGGFFSAGLKGKKTAQEIAQDLLKEKGLAPEKRQGAALPTEDAPAVATEPLRKTSLPDVSQHARADVTFSPEGGAEHSSVGSVPPVEASLAHLRNQTAALTR